MNYKSLYQKIKEWYFSHSKIIIICLKWILLFVFLFLVIRFNDLEKIKTSLSKISLLNFFEYIGILFISRILYAFRWKIIFQSITTNTNIPTSYFLSTNLLAEFTTIALPTSIGGEITRFLKINQKKQNAVISTTSIFIDRLIGISTMMVDSIFILLLMDQNFFFNIDKMIPEKYMFPIIGGGFFLGILSIWFFLKWLKSKNLSEKFETASILLKKNIGQLILAILISLIAHLIFSLSHVVLFQKLFPIPILSVIGVILTPQLARSIPISILGISGGEGLMVISQMMVGLPQNIALTITLISLLARYLFAACGFLIEFLKDGINFITDLPK